MMADDLDLVFCACDEQTNNGVTNGTDGFLNKKEFMANKCQVQLWTFAYVQSINKPYENEFTLRGKNTLDMLQVY